MKALEIIEKLDAMEEYKSDAELKEWLMPRCEEYDIANPDDILGRAALYNELGSICRRNRWLDEGEKAFLEAKTMLENAGIRDGNYATTVNNLAGLYRLSGDFERSFELFCLCRELYSTMPELPVDTLASVCNNIGLLYLDKREHTRALVEFAQAESMIKAIPDNYYVHAVTAGNSAYAHYGLGDMKTAAECMLRAARYAEKLGGRSGEMYRNYMELYRRLGGEEQE